MKHIIHALLIFIGAVTIIGCKDTSDISTQIANTEPNETASAVSTTIPIAEDTFEIMGTVTYKHIEGGFYAIDGDDGRKYDPINLPDSFKKDGLKVKVTARLKKDAMSFHMYGAIIEVVNIAAQ
jgi:hypothetical protein